MTVPRREYAGGAPATTIDSDITSGSTTITVVSGTGYPTGGTGVFFIAVDAGQATEEKIRCSARSANTFTVDTSGRGVDGTSAASHSAGAVVQHVFTATDADDANAHIADTSRDDHTQYLNTTRHDVTARHTFGAALGTPAAPADVSTTAAAGSGTVPARSDHVHELADGSIDASSLFATGVVDQAAIADAAEAAIELVAVNTGKSNFAHSFMLMGG